MLSTTGDWNEEAGSQEVPESEKEGKAAPSCPTVRDPMDCSLPGSPVHGIFQARVLEWGAIAFSSPSTISTKSY